MKEKKSIYFFGNKAAEGNGRMRNLLGGKGANLAEMNLLGIPVPPGFTIITDVCNDYYERGEEKIREYLDEELRRFMNKVEISVGEVKFGDNTNPLLVSVRSGSRASMPGMMDTILNLGLNDESVLAVAERSSNPRFAWDSYRRFIQMYGDVVLGLKYENKKDISPFEELIEKIKYQQRIELDTDLETSDLIELVKGYKKIIKDKTGKDFPSDPWEQLWGAIMAVFRSWMNERAILYRRLNKIPEEWGTAVNVQAMVFGNMGDTSATGVAFTRDAATGEDIFNGEYLINAQGEDVVAGIRTPHQITLEGSHRWAALQNIDEEERKFKSPSLEEIMPEVFQDLFKTQQILEKHYKDMQDIEFTIQKGKLWMLQTRNAKRTGAASVRVAIEMLEKGIISEKEAILRIEPERLNELLHPIFKPEVLRKSTIIAKGLPASPGAATGQIVFFAEDAARKVEENKDCKIILVRVETSPEDLKGMHVSEWILTARGGLTSHAAVVARGMGKCCISGVSELHIDYKEKIMHINGKLYREGDWISLNGFTGEVIEGQVETQDAEIDSYFAKLMTLTSKYSQLKVRANADTPKDALIARNFGAQGIGLCRTEHMFFEGDKIIAMREMILSENEEERRKALSKLLPIQQKDFEGIFRAMSGFPVIIRLLDPPLHEFLPQDYDGQLEMSKVMNVCIEDILKKIENLKETNPMLGHRGCRLANTFPEITEMQTRALITAALNLKKEGVVAVPEVMVPLTGTLKEMKIQEEIIRNTIEKVFKEKNDKIEYQIGSMIEVPRAALTADRIAESAEFFSFGTNDLTQLTYGYSRDDVGKFLPTYIEKGILKSDPFQTIDKNGVGQLVEMATIKGRTKRPLLKVGICGEHGGDPDSVEFCHSVGINYVSCSPYRVPIARLATAQAAIKSLN